MNKQTEALKMAIEAMEKYVGVVKHKFNAETWGDIEDGGKPARNAIQACKEALELSEKQHTISDKEQPAPSWQGLSDDEINDWFATIGLASKGKNLNQLVIDFARAIEQALRSKNER